MKGVLFFIFLCLTLVGNYDPAVASVSHKTPSSSQSGLTNTCQDYSFITHKSPDSPAIDIICEDIEEDDDTNHSTARKYRLLNGYSPTLPSFHSNNPSDFDSRPIFASYLTGIYIVQRAIRI